MLNVAAIVGRMTKDPEMRKTQNGTDVCSFTVAVDKGKDKQADFLDVVAWKQTAEFVCKYFKKGQMIAVDGSLSTRTWENKEGKKQKAVEIVARNVNFCGGRETKSEKQEDPAEFTAVDDNGDLPF